MRDSSITRRQSRAKALAAAAGYFAMVVGVLVLVGWWFRIDFLKRVGEGMISMNPLTALCLVLAGISLVVQLRRPVPMGRVLAACILAVGVFEIIGYLLGWGFPLDRMLFAGELQSDEPGAMNRIAPNTALGFIMLGLGLLTLDERAIRGIRLAEFFSMGLALIASLVIVGYIYQIGWLFGFASYIPMALHTAVTLLVLSAGMVFARPDGGLMAVVTGNSAGGLLARRLFPMVALVFVMAGGLKLLGERRGYYTAGQGEALYTVLSIGLFGAFVLLTARSLHRTDGEKTRLENERESFFSLSLDLFGIMGMDGYFKRVNPAFCSTLGYAEEEILARPLYELVHPDDLAATRVEMESLLSGMPTLCFENRYRCKDGSWVWLQWNTSPFSNGIVHAVARDVTGKKRTEAELARQAVHLESLNHELEAFSYSVSHDLRAPLRGVSGFAQALEERETGNLDSTSLGYLHRIRKAAAFMAELIDDLLQLSRLTRAEMRMKPVNLSGMARELTDNLRLAEPERRVEVVIGPDIMVIGDPALLRIMMSNLLSNAWKFTARNPEARIELARGTVEGGRLWCHVRDNGVGFDNRYADKLFGAFQRLHSQDEFRGTGIGLATVQRVIRRHGGEVSGSGVIDEGAVFRFSLDPVRNGGNP